jgi:hypothetical protein
VFDRFIQIWLENTDFAQAASQAVFTNLSTQGITLTGYFGVTHPSQPNYLAAAGGDFWGLASDDMENIPTNMSTIVDLLDQKNISWGSYQENMPTDGFGLYNYTNQADGYTYYVRKHNPLVIYDSVGTVSSRAARIRNFNDFAVDVRAHFVRDLKLTLEQVGNNTLPQWMFVTPNLRKYVYAQITILCIISCCHTAMVTIPMSHMPLTGLIGGSCLCSMTLTSIPTRRSSCSRLTSTFSPTGP